MQLNEFVGMVMGQLADFLKEGQKVEFDVNVGHFPISSNDLFVGKEGARLQFFVTVDGAKQHTPEI